MNRKGWDSTRRNRKIGTAASGWRRQSQFVIPERWENWRPYYENISNPVQIQRRVHTTLLNMIVEPTLDNYIHACTPSDIARMINLLPSELIFGKDPLAGVVLRQPTRKQNTLRPVWGRICYQAEVANSLNGPVIFIEAIPRDWNQYHWEKKLNVEAQQELNRMKHLIGNYRTERRSISFEFGLINQRRWLLYHTLIHEMGHLHDYSSRVTRPEDPELQKLTEDERLDRYFQRPVMDREAYAHRYSDTLRNQLIDEEQIPFARMLDDEALLRSEGIDPKWFRPEEMADNDAGPKLNKYRDS